MCVYVYLIDLSPLGLFWANETNYWNKRNRLRIPTGRRQTSWLCTSAAEELNQALTGKSAAGGQSATDFKSGALTTRPQCLHQASASVRLILATGLNSGDTKALFIWRKVFPGKRVTLPAEWTLASVYMKKSWPLCPSQELAAHALIVSP